MIGIKEFNKKIVSLKNTRKITKTMKMVSASKFKRAHKAQTNALVYAEKLQRMMERVFSTEADHPLMRKPDVVSSVLILVVTSDKGLCGGFNNNLLRHLKRWLQEKRQAYPKVTLSFCGRRGFMSFRKTHEVYKHYELITYKPDFSQALNVAHDLANDFLEGKFQEVYVASNRFIGAITHEPVIEKVLPVQLDQLPQKKQGQAAGGICDYEPSQGQLFGMLIPKFLNFRIFYTLLENAAGEHGARMSAMDKAFQNTSELIEKYTLLRNRARQSSITTELIEIISGAEALK